MDFKEKKIEAYEFGKYAEDMIAREYIRRGYVVRERNWKMGKTEIDIILQKDDVIVLVEVKARKSDQESAVSAVVRDKRKRMIKAADKYLQNCDGMLNYRFDIAACTGTRDDFHFEILEDAFVAADLI